MLSNGLIYEVLPSGDKDLIRNKSELSFTKHNDDEESVRSDKLISTRRGVVNQVFPCQLTLRRKLLTVPSN